MKYLIITLALFISLSLQADQQRSTTSCGTGKTGCQPVGMWKIQPTMTKERAAEIVKSLYVIIDITEGMEEKTALKIKKEVNNIFECIGYPRDMRLDLKTKEEIMALQRVIRSM